MEIKSIDMNAFDAVYDAYAEKVYRIALYYSKDHHAAEDITQMVFMKWYTCRENVNVDRVEAWIKATAKHMAFNYRRDNGHEIDLDSEEMEYLIDGKVYEKSVETILAYRYRNEIRREMIEKIYEELYRKNSRWYEAITVLYILEKPQKDVADMMGISIGSLRIMLHRAKNWIRKQYQEQLDHLDDE